MLSGPDVAESLSAKSDLWICREPSVSWVSTCGGTAGGPQNEGDLGKGRETAENTGPFFDIYVYLYVYLCSISGVYKVAIGRTNP